MDVKEKPTNLVASNLRFSGSGKSSACLTTTVLDPPLSGVTKVPRKVRPAEPPVSGTSDVHA